VKILFSKFAKLELEDAMRYYEVEQLELGQRFKNEVRKAVERIF